MAAQGHLAQRPGKLARSGEDSRHRRLLKAAGFAIVSTLAYFGLYAALRPMMTSQMASFVSQGVTAVGSALVML